MSLIHVSANVYNYCAPFSQGDICFMNISHFFFLIFFCAYFFTFLSSLSPPTITHCPVVDQSRHIDVKVYSVT
jgi:hypothetical protein